MFHDPGAQPLLDEANHAPVSDPVLDELHQPAVVDGIEEPTDVGVEHPVHLLRPDPDRERVQRIMLTTPGRNP